MNNYKKSAIVLFSACIILVASSCARRSATGCPVFGKLKQEQTNKKSV